jgi:hypothetical protein
MATCNEMDDDPVGDDLETWRCVLAWDMFCRGLCAVATEHTGGNGANGVVDGWNEETKPCKKRTTAITLSPNHIFEAYK